MGYRVYLTFVFDNKVNAVVRNLTKEYDYVLSHVDFEFKGRKINAAIRIEGQEELRLLGSSIPLYYAESKEEVVTSEKIGFSMENVFLAAIWIFLSIFFLFVIRSPEFLNKHFDNF